MKSESQRKSDLVKDVNRHRGEGWYARRLEDQYTVGMPDLIVGMPYDHVCLIEAKLIDGNTFGPTLRQHIELERWERGLHRLSLVLGFDQDGLFYLHKRAEVVNVKDCEVSDPGEPFHLFLLRFIR